MKKIFEVLSKPARLILIIAAFAYVGVYSVVALGGFGGGFLPVLANIIIYVLTAGAVVAIPILLLLKKEEAAKLVFLLIGAYWLISESRGLLSYAHLVTENNEGLSVAYGVFGFLGGLALTGVVVLIVLKYILKKEVFKFCAVLTFVVAYSIILIFFILRFAYQCKINYEYRDYDYITYKWSEFVDLFLYLIAPVGVLFGYLYFLGAPEYDFPKKAPKEEKPEEPKEEAEPVEEQPEEVPEEEPAPEEKPE